MSTLSLTVVLSCIVWRGENDDRRPAGADVCRFRYKKVWKTTIVFDEYTYGPSTKDVKHLRRKTTTKQNKKLKGRKSDVTYCLRVTCCCEIKPKIKTTTKPSWRIQTTNSASSTNWAMSWSRIYLKHSMLLTMLIVSLLVKPLNWWKEQPPLSLEKTRTYWCFYYFTSSLSTAKFCSRPVQSLQPKSRTWK